MAKPKDPNVSEILDSVHKRMIAKYKQSGQLKKDIAQAKILTDFLSTLKLRAYSRTSAPNIQEDMYDMILDNIVLPNGRTLHNLFRRIGRTNKDTGQKFEDDLGAVIASVVNLTQNKQNKRTTYKTFALGNVTGTTDINLLEESEEVVDDFTRELAKDVKENIEDNQPGFVMGKIDTFVNRELVNMNANLDIPDSLLEALSFASFTDKSYRSVGWDKNLQKEINLGDRTIHLGNSHPYRAILGSMSALGFSKTDSQYVYYAGKNIVNGNDNDPPPESADYVKQHIYHLRYMYELTGAGILYRDFSGTVNNGAKFLVYNDPNSVEILCVSTAQIVMQLLETKDFPDNPYGSIGISKAQIRALNSQ